METLSFPCFKVMGPSGPYLNNKCIKVGANDILNPHTTKETSPPELSQSHSPRHLGELIYHYGESQPCGSFISTSTPGDKNTSGDTITPGDKNTPHISLASSRPHAMLMDQTHDNPCPFDQHPLPNVLALSGWRFIFLLKHV